MKYIKSLINQNQLFDASNRAKEGQEKQKIKTSSLFHKVNYAFTLEFIVLGWTQNFIVQVHHENWITSDRLDPANNDIEAFFN